MNEDQVVQTVDLILEFYDHLKLEDFVRFFKGMKVEKYGKFYEGIDGGKIMGALNQYDEQREDEIIEFRRKEAKEKSISQSDLKNIQPQFVEQLNKLSEKLSPEKNILPSIAKREKSELDKLVNKYLKEFDVKYEEQERGKQIKMGARILNYKGRQVDCSEYSEIRFSEEFPK